MAVAANTVETYDNSVIREDLQQAYSMISPEEVPFQQAIGRKSVDSTLFEWPVVDLADPDPTNRVIEGDDAPGTDAGTLAVRLQNYTQISDKVVSVSHTSEAVDAAAENVQRMAKQITLKLKELKRDVEIMLLDNTAAVPGSSGAARTTAGLPAFLRTNTVRTAAGADPTLSGGTEGYPNAAATPGTTPASLTEDNFRDVIQLCWEAGAEPTIALVNAGNKRVITETFTGVSTRYKDATDKRLVSAIDIYTSDFGELTVVPTRFMRTNNPAGANTSYNVFILDPNFARLCTLEGPRQKPLSESGHSKKRLIWMEYGLQVDNEAAHGVIADTTNA